MSGKGRKEESTTTKGRVHREEEKEMRGEERRGREGQGQGQALDARTGSRAMSVVRVWSSDIQASEAIKEILRKCACARVGQRLVRQVKASTSLKLLELG